MNACPSPLRRSTSALALAGLSLVALAAPARAQVFVEEFTGGTNEGGWVAWWNVYNTLESSGGNPGWYLRLDDLGGPATCHFVEIFSTVWPSAFSGDYRALGVVGLGLDVDADRARLELIRSVIGPDRTLMVDANQVWDVPAAIDHIRALAPVGLGWVEEPTSPDDVLGHAAIAAAIAPIPVATGEMAQNRIIFKQLLAAGAIGVAQPDACRLASVNEFIAVLLLCAQRGVPVCPHAGGVGLNEYVVQLAAFDQIAVAATSAGRVVEHVDDCVEHIVNPAAVEAGRYRLPAQPGYGPVLRAESVATHRYPDGPAWAGNP